MRRRTTTHKINESIKNNLLLLQKAEIYDKTTRITQEIPIDKFLNDFEFFCESGIFTDAIGWHYERDYKTKNYEIECSRMDGNSNIIITAYFSVCDGVSREDVEATLLFLEDE